MSASATNTDMLKALVVESAAERYNTLAEVLKNCGYAVTNAADLEALQAATSGQEKFDIVFCNETVGDASGLEIVKELKKKQPTLAVIFVTENADSPAAAEAKQLGVNEIYALTDDVSTLYPKLGAIQESAGKKRKGTTVIQPVKLTDLETTAKPTDRANVDMIMDVPVSLTAVLGSSTMAIADLLQLGPGSIVELNKRAGEPIELYVNEKLIAVGEVVVVNETFGIRITEVCDHKQRVQALV
jgi:flagellar motor switch protein FliN